MNMLTLTIATDLSFSQSQHSVNRSL